MTNKMCRYWRAQYNESGDPRLSNNSLEWGLTRKVGENSSFHLNDQQMLFFPEMTDKSGGGGAGGVIIMRPPDPSFAHTTVCWHHQLSNYNRAPVSIICFKVAFATFGGYSIAAMGHISKQFDLQLNQADPTWPLTLAMYYFPIRGSFYLIW